MLEISVSCGKCDRQKQRRMAQLGQKPHGFKDLDFLMVLGNAAVVFGAKWTPVASQTVRVCAPQWGSQSWLPSGVWTCWKACPQARLSARNLFSRKPRACPSERSDCFGGAGFSLSTPARGRISSQSRIPADSVTGTASGRVISHKAVSGQLRYAEKLEFGCFVCERTCVCPLQPANSAATSGLSNPRRPCPTPTPNGRL